jgi:peptidoglycan/LPS O-acetylase OafA/YrhL
MSVTRDDVTRPRFLFGGAVVALVLGAAVVVLTGDKSHSAARFAATALPTTLPFVLGTPAPRGRRTLWLVLTVLVTAGWTSAVIGLCSADGDPSFAGLHGWLACALACVVALVATIAGMVHRRRHARDRTAF